MPSSNKVEPALPLAPVSASTKRAAAAPTVTFSAQLANAKSRQQAPVKAVAKVKKPIDQSEPSSPAATESPPPPAVLLAALAPGQALGQQVPLKAKNKASSQDVQITPALTLAPVSSPTLAMGMPAELAAPMLTSAQSTPVAASSRAASMATTADPVASGLLPAANEAPAKSDPAYLSVARAITLPETAVQTASLSILAEVVPTVPTAAMPKPPVLPSAVAGDATATQATMPVAVPVLESLPVAALLHGTRKSKAGDVETSASATTILTASETRIMPLEIPVASAGISEVAVPTASKKPLQRPAAITGDIAATESASSNAGSPLPILSSVSLLAGMALLPEGAAPAVRLDTPDWAGQLTQAMLPVLQQGQGSLQIQVHPAELGPIQIAVQQNSSGQLNIALQVSSPQTQEFLQQNQNHLQLALNAQGISSAQVQVSFTQQGPGQGFAHHQPQTPRFTPQASIGSNQIVDNATSATVSQSGLLDVWI